MSNGNLNISVSGGSTPPSATHTYVTTYTQPTVGELRHQGNTVQMWDGTKWLDVSPNQMGGTPAKLLPDVPSLDLDATPVDALALAIYTAYKMVPGANLPAAREAAADVVKTLDELGFVIQQGRGSVTGAHLEEDFDFSDICTPCAAATDEYAAWHQGAKDEEAPDRFCLFHRGYVMGQLA